MAATRWLDGCCGARAARCCGWGGACRRGTGEGLRQRVNAILPERSWTVSGLFVPLQADGLLGILCVLDSLCETLCQSIQGHKGAHELDVWVALGSVMVPIKDRDAGVVQGSEHAVGQVVGDLVDVEQQHLDIAEQVVGDRCGDDAHAGTVGCAGQCLGGRSRTVCGFTLLFAFKFELVDGFHECVSSGVVCARRSRDIVRSLPVGDPKLGKGAPPPPVRKWHGRHFVSDGQQLSSFGLVHGHRNLLVGGQLISSLAVT